MSADQYFHNIFLQDVLHFPAIHLLEALAIVMARWLSWFTATTFPLLRL